MKPLDLSKEQAEVKSLDDLGQYIFDNFHRAYAYCPVTGMVLQNSRVSLTKLEMGNVTYSGKGYYFCLKFQADRRFLLPIKKTLMLLNLWVDRTYKTKVPGLDEKLVIIAWLDTWPGLKEEILFKKLQGTFLSDLYEVSYRYEPK